MALTPLQVQDVCHGGGNWWSPGTSGGICKYIDSVVRKDGKYVHVCTKLNAGAFAALEKRRGTYPGQKFTDNCAGYLLLHYKEQGYDK